MAGGGGGGGGASSVCPAAPPKGPPGEAGLQNKIISLYLVSVWLGLIGLILAQRLVLSANRHVRRLVGTSNEKQTYFARPNARWATFRKHWLEAPLFRERHNREFRLTSTVGLGTLPTRAQACLVVSYVAINIVLSCLWLPWSSARTALLSDFYRRTGVLSVVNMVPLFILAGRSNPLISLLDISFDSYNLMHRWLGRIVVIEAILHTLSFSWYKVLVTNWACFWQSFSHSGTVLTGTIAIAAFTVILLHSPAPVRHAFYETFLHVHITLALLVLIVIWMHLKSHPSRNFLAAVIGVWIVERVWRIKQLLYNNVGAGGTHAEVEALPGDAMRVTLHLARPWKFQPGQHVYLYMPSIGLWTNHPFSLAWSSDDASITPCSSSPTSVSSASSPDDKHRSMVAHTAPDLLSRPKPTISLLIRRRTGFTDALWRRVSASPTGSLTARAFVEGPYGHQSLSSYGTVVLFAAGVGITHQVPFLRSLIADAAEGTGATRRVTLVWIVQSAQHLEWIRPWMTEVLAMHGRRAVLNVLLFVTRPRSEKDVAAPPSSSLQIFPGKPDVAALVRQAQNNQIGAMAVSVCGTGSLGDDVRAAVRGACQSSTVDLFENSFSW